MSRVMFWNSTRQRSLALTVTNCGIMSLSGYSNELMTLFLNKGDVVEPKDELYHAMSGGVPEARGARLVKTKQNVIYVCAGCSSKYMHANR